MQQAGYSPQDLAGMTKAFEKKYPNITVNNTLVPYDALHDKIVAAAPAGTYDVVLGDCIWPAEFGSKGIVQDISSDVNSLAVDQIFPGAIQMALYQSKYYGQPWILDTKYLYYNKHDVQQGRRLDRRPEDPRRPRRRAQEDQELGGRPVPVDRLLGAGRGGDLRLRAVPRRLWRQVPRLLRKGRPSTPAAASRRSSS